MVVIVVMVVVSCSILIASFSVLMMAVSGSSLMAVSRVVCRGVGTRSCKGCGGASGGRKPAVENWTAVIHICLLQGIRGIFVRVLVYAVVVDPQVTVLVGGPMMGILSVPMVMTMVTVMVVVM